MRHDGGAWRDIPVAAGIINRVVDQVVMGVSDVWRTSTRNRLAVVALMASAVVPLAPAVALDVELRDFAPDRVERQRAYTRGEMPLPTTPDLKDLDGRLAARGLSRGRPIFIRVFKATSELEVWMQKGDRFELLDIYPICNWTGTLGPKIKEGDRQSPEGFYSVVNRQMRLVGRWQKAFNLGFPNPYDQTNKRTGSFILVHGGCSSVGCFAMTEQVQEEIFALADAAIKGGQQRFHVQAFPFRMTDEAMKLFADHTWAPFWRDLKAGYDSFERTRIPPRVGLCGDRYHVSDGEPGDVGNSRDLMPLPRNGSSCAFETAKETSKDIVKATRKQTVVSAKIEEEDERPEKTQVRRRSQTQQQPARNQNWGKSNERSSGEASRTATPSSSAPVIEVPNGFGDTPKKGNQLTSGG